MEVETNNSEGFPTIKELQVLLLRGCPEVHDWDKAGVPVVADVQVEAGGQEVRYVRQFISHLTIIWHISFI